MDIPRIVATLKCLLNGGTVTFSIGDCILSDDYEVCLVRKDTNGNTRYLRTGIEFKNFVSLTEKMRDEDFLNIAAQNVLTPGRGL